MDEKNLQICGSVELPTDDPWLVAHNLDPEKDDTGDQIFFTVHNPMSHYRCRIAELVGRRIRACFHGWMILSRRNPEDIEWSLWNPLISKLIHLPRLILKDEDDYVDDFRHCCLSSPPDDPNPSGSVLLLMRSTKQNIVFINCTRKKRLRRWTEMSYSRQMENIRDAFIDYDDDDDYFLVEPTCCNGIIYAWSSVTYPPLLIQVQITAVNRKRILINLFPLVKLPCFGWQHRGEDYFFLKGSCERLFTITLCVDDEKRPCDVNLFKLDMHSMVWTEIKDLKDTVFFVSLAARNDLVYSSPPIATESRGGYIHILEKSRKVIYSYNVNDNLISMSLIHCLDLPRCGIFVWTMPPEFRLHGRKANCKLDEDPTTTNVDDDDDDDDGDDACLLNDIPFDVLELIMKFCRGIEYLNFRATCKLCRLAAPVIQWRNEITRLQTYSLVSSPWLMVVDKNHGIVTFTDPMFGDYFMKASRPELLAYHWILLAYHRILCSMHGWLLLNDDLDRCIAFFNPFTGDFRKLPVETLGGVERYAFSAPPTSPDCVVVAFLKGHDVSFHRVGGEPSWCITSFDFDASDLPHDFQFPVFCGEYVYTLNGGRLEVSKGFDNDDDFSLKKVVDAPRTSTRAKYFQVKCDQHHLMVMLGEFGESVEVFELNDYTQKWEEIDCLGRHVIYICDTSCVCMDAKIPELENKICFSRLYNGRIVFYSLKTRRFHTFNGRNVEENLVNLFGTKQTVHPHVWIEPTWS